MDNTTKTTKEYFIIKIHHRLEEDVYQTESVKGANITPDIKHAKKFKNEETAESKARQICEMNNAVVHIIRYITQTSVRITDLHMFIPKKQSKK